MQCGNGFRNRMRLKSHQGSLYGTKLARPESVSGQIPAWNVFLSQNRPIELDAELGAGNRGMGLK